MGHHYWHVPILLFHAVCSLRLIVMVPSVVMIRKSSIRILLNIARGLLRSCVILHHGSLDSRYVVGCVGGGGEGDLPSRSCSSVGMYCRSRCGGSGICWCRPESCCC